MFYIVAKVNGQPPFVVYGSKEIGWKTTESKVVSFANVEEAEVYASKLESVDQFDIVEFD